MPVRLHGVDELRPSPGRRMLSRFQLAAAICRAVSRSTLSLPPTVLGPRTRWIHDQQTGTRTASSMSEAAAQAIAPARFGKS